MGFAPDFYSLYRFSRTATAIPVRIIMIPMNIITPQRMLTGLFSAKPDIIPENGSEYPKEPPISLRIAASMSGVSVIPSSTVIFNSPYGEAVLNEMRY